MICAHCRRPLRRPAAEVGRMKCGRICARPLRQRGPAEEAARLNAVLQAQISEVRREVARMGLKAEDE